jgi:PAS domain-containing protein
VALDVGGEQKNLLLILARQLAANLATPMFLINPAGMLCYYNEAAESIIGKPFELLGEVPVSDWAATLDLADLAEEPIKRSDTPPGVAFLEHRPAHRLLLATAFDGKRRRIAVTAYPLFSKVDEFAGVVAIFWENSQAG